MVLSLNMLMLTHATRKAVSAIGGISQNSWRIKESAPARGDRCSGVTLPQPNDGRADRLLQLRPVPKVFPRRHLWSKGSRIQRTCLARFDDFTWNTWHASISSSASRSVTGFDGRPVRARRRNSAVRRPAVAGTRKAACSSAACRVRCSWTA
jgi:hypothetical protein